MSKDNDNDYQGYDGEPDEPDFVDDGSGLPDFLQGGNEGTNLDEDSDYDFDDNEFQTGADDVYAELLARIGEGAPQPRLEPTRRAVELLGDPHRAYPVIHIAGTNGKTSTSRITESILRAYGLKTGLLTSPHLTRVNERIVIDGQPISNRALVENWADIRPFLQIIDADLAKEGEPELTFFEALTVLAFASFADAPVDVAVIEVGMGGEWDSTNVADGQVAVFTPIALDHTQRLGNTVAEIARTKSGIIKPVANVVSATQTPEALAELQRAAELTESSFSVQGADFALESTTVAVGGQVISVKGLAASYPDLFLPMFGDHQAQNATLAIAAVESFLGGGSNPLVTDVLAEGLAEATSPGRLQIIGTEPTVLVDAAHNPHGAEALASAIGSYFTFDEVAVVIGVLQDKDADGIVAALAPIATRFYVTQSESDRAVDADDLAYIVRTHTDEVYTDESAEAALEAAREWADQGEKRAVLVTGSITLVGDAIRLGVISKWKR
ncbi:dihydrofolate synthase/folylpolyglutamate synthase [Conyzicola lurida]|uniref:tetrahydrofolate synthase n=1 Tax=Conyzicola lurida TaxID=1172621 RepID=A0A841AMH6_9MICO|nr:folylpolyglutamate synthase/dihydrofolate synthase family protein [Conyzicola lurida]MBB5843534.1 dihydrofolate synthase/folylpolyglutamate synthase [Conyzicola lurida]